MKAYSRTLTLISSFLFIQISFSQGGTIRVDKTGSNSEIFGLEGNRSGEPQSFILLIDGSKAAFINSYYDADYVWDKFLDSDFPEGNVYPGIYKFSGSEMVLFFSKGLGFDGSRVGDALFLLDNYGNQVVFYKIYK